MYPRSPRDPPSSPRQYPRPEPSKSYGAAQSQNRPHNNGNGAPSSYDDRALLERERLERERRERERERELREKERLLREKERQEKERQQQRERELRERELREREIREREREKAAAQVSTPKKKVEQRISTMTEAQIMEKLRSVVTKGDPNDYYKKIKRVGQG